MINIANNLALIGMPGAGKSTLGVLLAKRTARSFLDTDLLIQNAEDAPLQEIIDNHSEPWGIKVSLVEIKHVDLPQEMQRAIAKQAEAERERRAKIIHAEGEFQASTKLRDAAEVISAFPEALQLRFLQTLTEVAAENNSTIIFPLPLDLFKHFMQDKK